MLHFLSELAVGEALVFMPDHQDSVFAICLGRVIERLPNAASAQRNAGYAADTTQRRGPRSSARDKPRPLRVYICQATSVEQSILGTARRRPLFRCRRRTLRDATESPCSAN